MQIGEKVVVEMVGELLSVKQINGDTFYMVMDDGTKECCLVKRNSVRGA